jgi:hypothetical protein
MNPLLFLLGKQSWKLHFDDIADALEYDPTSTGSGFG